MNPLSPRASSANIAALPKTVLPYVPSAVGHRLNPRPSRVSFQMKHITIGVDNGSSGSIAIISPDGSIFEPMPTKKALMGKKGKVVKRIDHEKLGDILTPYIGSPVTTEIRAFIERPFTGSPMMINTCVLSARAFEAVLIVLELAGIGYTVVDSKEWQKALLGAVRGSAALKEASGLRGAEIYPAHAKTIEDHGDADGLLIAHHYHPKILSVAKLP